MSTTTVLTTEKPRRWLARRRDDVEKMMGGGKRDDDYIPERLKHAARPATKPDRMIQLVFALGLLVPLVAFACMDPAGAVDAYALQYATIKQLPRYIMTGPFVAAVLCLCVERVCYTLVWCCPRAFGEFCSKHNLGAPVDVIVRLFGVNKFFQLLGFAHLYLLGGLAPPPSLFALGVGAALILWGQALNVGAEPASRLPSRRPSHRRRRDRATTTTPSPQASTARSARPACITATSSASPCRGARASPSRSAWRTHSTSGPRRRRTGACCSR